jgi:hypothetical protein
MIFMARTLRRAFLYHAGLWWWAVPTWGLLIAPVLITILIRLIVYVLGIEFIHHVLA